jgi:O-methyltransferase
MPNAKLLAKRALFYVADKSKTVRRIATAIHRANSNDKDTYEYLRERFIRNGKNHSVSESHRSVLVRRFELIDTKVPIATTPTDGLFLAEMVLNIKADGDFVECGCFAGGSSAKLSILAKLLNRKLIICDSFEGLPAAEEYYLRDKHCRRSDDFGNWGRWTKGDYASPLEEMRSNVANFGEVSACNFVKGWFSETLNDSNLPQRLSFVFADVDLANSARDCLESLWPRLDEHGIFVTHETAYIKVLQAFYRPEIWRDKFHSMPPILFGAGFGLCNESPHLGYMVKGDQLSPEYLKSLTIDK